VRGSYSVLDNGISTLVGELITRKQHRTGSFLAGVLRSRRGRPTARVRKKHSLPGLYSSQIPPQESFWITLKLSSIVIINLIAKVPFLDHKL
jgi:hypothetical protein